jgi:hypothetical protein
MFWWEEMEQGVKKSRSQLLSILCRRLQALHCRLLLKSKVFAIVCLTSQELWSLHHENEMTSHRGAHYLSCIASQLPQKFMEKLDYKYHVSRSIEKYLLMRRWRKKRGFRRIELTDSISMSIFESIRTTHMQFGLNLTYVYQKEHTPNSSSMILRRRVGNQLSSGTLIIVL